MYNRSKRHRLLKMTKSQLIMIPIVLGFVVYAVFQALHFGTTQTRSASKVDADQVVETTTNSTTTSTSTTTQTETTEATTQAVTEATPEQQTAVQEVAQTQAPVQQGQVPTYAQQAATPVNYQGALANGNTAGAEGKAAAAQMAAATGVSQSTWEYIIARESNGQVGARNASGASGLFQTMPGWGSTATVQDQVNSAIKAYNSQGMSAWGM